MQVSWLQTTTVPGMFYLVYRTLVYPKTKLGENIARLPLKTNPIVVLTVFI